MDTSRELVAATKRQSTAAVQNAGACPVARWVFAATLLLASSGKLTAAPAAPEFNKVEPFVWQVGATNEITIEGKELANVRGLWTSRHGVLEGNQLDSVVEDAGKRLKLTIPISGREAAGPLAMRLLTVGGISAPIVLMLEKLPELKMDDGNIVAEEGWRTGSIKDATGEKFRVRLKRGQAMNLEVLAGRLGSKLDPVLRILNDDSKELAYVQDSPCAGVDCNVRFDASQNGNYVIEIRDAQYGSGDGLKFHLRYGSSPGGGGIPWIVGSETWQNDDAFVDGSKDRLKRELANKPLAMFVTSNPDFLWGLDDFRLLAHASYRVRGFHYSLNGKPVDRTTPDGVSIDSFLTEANEVHHYTLTIDHPGQRRFTALSRRLGGERDPVMRLKSGDGKAIKSSHLFQNETVLIHDFKEPGSYLLEVWDAAGQHGDFGGYHIRIERDPANFELNTETDSLRIPAGGEGELSVKIDRDGYEGPVKFELAHGPEGVELSDVVAKEKSKEAKFKVKLAASLTPGTTFPLKISGRRGEGDKAPKTPLYTSAYWKKRFPDLHSPMFEFEDTVWVTVLPP